MSFGVRRVMVYMVTVLGTLAITGSVLLLSGVRLHRTSNRARQIVEVVRSGAPISGVTSMDDELFVLRSRVDRSAITVFNRTSRRAVRRLGTPRFPGHADIAACALHRCLYIANTVDNFVYRVDVGPRGGTVAAAAAAAGGGGGNGTRSSRTRKVERFIRWPVGDKPAGMSVTARFTLLVTCTESSQLKEFTSDGKLVRTIDLRPTVTRPHHAIEVAPDEFVISSSAAVQRVRIVNSNNNNNNVQIVGTAVLPGQKRFKKALRMAVDARRGLLFVADSRGRRVVALRVVTLKFVREVVAPSQLRWSPYRLHVDGRKRRLYVADSGTAEEAGSAGHVHVHQEQRSFANGRLLVVRV